MLDIPVTQVASFRERRARFARGLAARGVRHAALAAGWSRPRNFAHNLFPFRAESHFLYLVGASLEGAVLAYEDGEVVLYVPRQSPEMDLWTGPEPSLAELEERLGLRVLTFDEFELPEATSVLPPQDEETASFLSSLLEREIVAQSGDELEEGDAALAETMVELRLVHDEAALAQLSFAASLGARGHRAGMREVTRSHFEYEVRAAMEHEFARFGLGTSYQSIVSQRGEILHNHHSPDRIRAGELLLCDVGCETREGFASDITRTFPTSGRFSGSQAVLYDLVLSVQEEAIQHVRAGVSFRQLHRQSALHMGRGLVDLGLLEGDPEELYELGSIAVFYPHGLGHLLGLDVHDMEDLGDRSGYAPERFRSEHPSERALRLDRDLAPGMVVTIEPGFYQSPLLLERARSDARIKKTIRFDHLERFADVHGIRIEDDVLVTKAGATVLSHDAPKSRSEIESVCHSSEG